MVISMYLETIEDLENIEDLGKIEDLETIEDIEAFCHRPNCSDNHDAIKDLKTI